MGFWMVGRVDGLGGGLYILYYLRTVFMNKDTVKFLQHVYWNTKSC